MLEKKQNQKKLLTGNNEVEFKMGKRMLKLLVATWKKAWRMVYLVDVECQRPHCYSHHALRVVEELDCLCVEREVICVLAGPFDTLVVAVFKALYRNHLIIEEMYCMHIQLER